MILCVTPNAAIDFTMLVDELRPGQIHRASESFGVAGGKGVNVARVVRALDGAAHCGGFLAGATGRYLADLAHGEGLEGDWTWVDGETRTCVMVAHPDHSDATVLNGAGMVVDGAAWLRLQADVLTAAARTRAGTLCFCGSLPPGSPVEAFDAALRACVAAGHHTWVDTSGAPLAMALAVPGVHIKVNRAELSAALGETLGSIASIAQAARKLMGERGLGAVAVTLGGEGAVLVAPAGAWAAAAPEVPVVSSVGSGDAMLAGLVLALERGDSPQDALRHAVAAGSANAMSLGGGRFTRTEFESIKERTHVVDIA